MKYLCTLALILCAFGVARSQTLDTTGTATAYVYSLNPMRTLGRVAPHVFVDDTFLARLDGERFFVAKIPAGRHSFH